MIRQPGRRLPNRRTTRSRAAVLPPGASAEATLPTELPSAAAPREAEAAEQVPQASVELAVGPSSVLEAV